MILYKKKENVKVQAYYIYVLFIEMQIKKLLKKTANLLTLLIYAFVTENYFTKEV